MRNRIISNIAFEVIIVDRDCTLAHRTSAAIGKRFVLWIGCKIPFQNVAAPVACCAYDQSSDGSCNIDGSTVFWFNHHLLGEVEVLVGMRIMYFRERLYFASI